MSNSSKFYVYKILGKNGELLYIGKGSGDRYKTHICGVSSNRNINRYFLLSGIRQINLNDLVSLFLVIVTLR